MQNHYRVKFLKNPINLTGAASKRCGFSKSLQINLFFDLVNWRTQHMLTLMIEISRMFFLLGNSLPVSQHRTAKQYVHDAIDDLTSVRNNQF